MTDTTESRGPSGLLGRVDKPLFAVTGGFILLFCALALISMDTLSAIVDWGFNIAATWFGLYWQVLLLATLVIGLVICVLPGGKAILGRLEWPEFTTFQWAPMIMCTLLAGGVFWAAGEPIAHYLSTPPVFWRSRGRCRRGSCRRLGMPSALH